LAKRLLCAFSSAPSTFFDPYFHTHLWQNGERYRRFPAQDGRLAVRKLIACQKWSDFPAELLEAAE
jgi:hypothetical protein